MATASFVLMGRGRRVEAGPFGFLSSRLTAMAQKISIKRFRDTIRRLPSDRAVVRPGIWYSTQKQHWLGWLGEYHGPGYYGRTSTARRDARFAYNHIVEVKMLLYLAKAAGASSRVLAEARAAECRARTLQAKAGAVRKVVPWELIEKALWKKPI